MYDLFATSSKCCAHKHCINSGGGKAAEKGYNPCLNSKAKSVDMCDAIVSQIGVRENVDWPIGEVNGQRA
jgi:hypothetical protein